MREPGSCADAGMPPPSAFVSAVRRRARVRMMRQGVLFGGLGVLATGACLTLMLVLAGGPPAITPNPNRIVVEGIKGSRDQGIKGKAPTLDPSSLDPSSLPIRPTILALSTAPDLASDISANLPGGVAKGGAGTACERDLRIGSLVSRETVDCLLSNL